MSKSLRARRRSARRLLRLEALEGRLLLAGDLDDALGEALSFGAASTAPAMYESMILPDTDVDMYGFTVTAGQTVDIDIDTPINGPGGLDSYVRLFNSGGHQLAFNDHAFAPGEEALGYDSYLRYTFTSTGTYYVGVSNATNTDYNAVNGLGDTAGGANATGTYTITVQALPVDADDALSEAVVLGDISETPVTVHASVTPDVDVDMYRFTVDANQVVDFDIDTQLNGPDGLESYLRLFNGQGQQLAFNNAGMAPGENLLGYDAFLRHTFSSRGTYYIAVSNAANTQYSASTGDGDTAGGLYAVGDYQLTIRTAPTVPTDTDDEISEAVSLGDVSTTPRTVTASITPDVDVNMYRFTVDANQVVDFDIDTALNGRGGLGSYLRLFNSQGQELSANNDGLAPGENELGFDAYLRYTFSSSGTYYLGVSNATNTAYNASTGRSDVSGGEHSTGEYTLTVQAVPGDGNDQLSEATGLGSITRDPETAAAIIVTDIDVDLYRFSVSSGQTVDFDIDTAENGTGGLGSYLRLFDSQGRQLASNNDGAAPGELVVGFDAYLRYRFTSSGTYYIGVSNANNTAYDPATGGNDKAGGLNSIGSYELIVQTAPDDPVDTDDETSEAIDLGAVTDSPVMVDTAITPDIDVDMYRFTVTAGQVVDFDVDTPFNGAGGLGAYLRLFNSQGSELASNNDGAAPGENEVGFDPYLRYTFASRGTYYLAVSNWNNTQFNPETGAGDTAGGNHAVGSYRLIVQGLPVDTDDSLSEATVLQAVTTTPQRVEDSIETDIDVDIYRFTVTEDQIVGFDIDTLQNESGYGLGSYLRLFDDDGRQLASNDDGAALGETVLGIDAYLQYTFTRRGTYYLAVSNANNKLFNPETGAGDTAGGLDSIGDYTLLVQELSTDNPTLSLLLSPPAIREDGGTATATITRQAGDVSLPLVVSLVSSDATAASVPTTVTIPANSATATFTVTGVDDTLLDGTQSATISANADGYVSAAAVVQVTDYETLTVTVSPGVMSEESGTATGTVRRSNTDNAAPLTVTLSSSDTSEATVPSQVVIPAGQAAVSFVVTARDDTLLDGVQTVIISATAAGYVGISGTVDVADSEGLELIVDVAAMSEQGGTATATVRRAVSEVAAALTVSLVSSDVSEATVPASVTIPAGAATVDFVITAVDDALLDGTRTVLITASGEGYGVSSASIDVTDYETITLTIDPTTITERGTATGTVVRSNTDDHTPLTVTLTSDDTTEATVPATVTIAADAASATFVVSGVEDAVVDRTQHVVVTASAAGFVGSSAGLDVIDFEAVLTLTLSGDLLSEHGGTLSGSVSRTTLDVTAPLVVSLTSSDVTAAIVPATVTIPGGALSAAFTVTGVDDTRSDGSQRTTIAASAPGFHADAKEIVVADDERPYQNPRETRDVDGDTFISPRDALLIINILNFLGTGRADVILDGYEGAAQFPDVNGDNYISAIDALLIINYLNNPEGEWDAGTTASDAARTATATSPARQLVPSLADEAYAASDGAWYDPAAGRDLRETFRLHRRRV